MLRYDEGSYFSPFHDPCAFRVLLGGGENISDYD
jgi:hypothetical protein